MKNEEKNVVWFYLKIKLVDKFENSLKKFSKIYLYKKIKHKKCMKYEKYLIYFNIITKHISLTFI